PRAVRLRPLWRTCPRQLLRIVDGDRVDARQLLSAAVVGVEPAAPRHAAVLPHRLELERRQLDRLPGIERTDRQRHSGNSNHRLRRSMNEPAVYVYVGDRRVPLIPDPQLFAVRLTRAAQTDALHLSEPARSVLGRSQPVTFLPREGLHVYRHDAATDASQLLRREPGVAQALPIYRRTPGGEDTVIVTTRLLAQFRADLDDAKIAALLDELKLRIVEPLPYASPRGFLLEASPGSDGLGAVAAANTLVERGYVVFAEPDLIQSRHWKDG